MEYTEHGDCLADRDERGEVGKTCRFRVQYYDAVP